MGSRKQMLSDCVFMLAILLAAFFVNLLLLELFGTRTMIPMIFVLGVMVVAYYTDGYFWGIAASLCSVLAVNYAFTYPYWAFDLISPECISAAVVMLVVATLTSTLTTKLKRQEQMKAEAESERMRGDLLRAVSHDLRTPLTSIYGACSVMLENYDELPKEKHMKLLADVCADAQWLVRMVENLLSITRVGGEGVKLTKKETVLEELTDARLQRVRYLLASSSLSVQQAAAAHLVEHQQGVAALRRVVAYLGQIAVAQVQPATVVAQAGSHRGRVAAGRRLCAHILCGSIVHVEGQRRPDCEKIPDKACVQIR